MGYGIYWAIFDIDRLPKEDFVSQVTSPDSTYTIKAYISSGGATTDFAVLGELNFNKEKRKPKNIYWNYPEQKAKIKWIYENTFVINGHELTLPQESFDYGRD
jgi:hypothetical protein